MTRTRMLAAAAILAAAAAILPGCSRLDFVDPEAALREVEATATRVEAVRDGVDAAVSRDALEDLCRMSLRFYRALPASQRAGVDAICGADDGAATLSAADRAAIVESVAAELVRLIGQPAQ